MLKNWAKWTLVILWCVLLLATTTYWNPFTSLPALLKYSVVSIFGAALFGGMYVVLWFWVMMAIIFPLPPRADAKAPKGVLRSVFPWMFKQPKINPKAPQRLEELVGNDQAKMEIREVIDMIANPAKYEASGADLPKGMLFVGPPGVGKTLFARAIANEVGLPFYVVEGGSISGLIMGLGVIKMKTLFAKLRSHGKAILFIDEIDSIGVRRQSDSGGGGIADMNMTLNTILTEMDGFKSSDILVIGATNNDGILDPALMRAGRMDRRIYFQTPDPAERQSLFKYYLARVKTDPEIDLEEIAKLTTNYSPAEIAGVVNEAALIAGRPGGPGRVTTEVVKQALTRLSVGLERTMVQTGLAMATVDANVRLDDVVGIDEVKQDVTEIVEFLKYGDELRKIGAKIPKGLLLIGPPGVGKTMLAKAMANEANVPFYALSASYLKGSGREAVGHIRALYSQARKSPAAIVFIDEIDAISGTMTEMGNNRTTALNQMLVELDGFSASNVITIGATNDENSLDPAFTRSGRFDRKAYIGLPDSGGRKVLFGKYLKTVKTEGELDIDKLAQASMNFSGADVAAAINEAAIIAVRKRQSSVRQTDVEEAIDRISITAGAKMNTDGMTFNRVADLEVKLDDVKGLDEAKNEAAEVVALLKNSDKISSMGLKAPKGVLLVGPPGTGKTMLAKAIANEAGVPIYFASGSDFVQKWVGLGAQRVRGLYERARRSGKPAIVFIDEIDAIASRRIEDRGAGGQNERNVTLNQLLVELDGFGKHKVLTIGATNNVDVLDPAILRAGRMDRHIEMNYPDIDGRAGILQHYLSKVKHDPAINMREVARMMIFRTGADISNVVNEAGLIAIRNGRDAITQVDLVSAFHRQSYGMSYSRQVLLDELTRTAYHEAGHAIVAYYKNNQSRIHIITVVPAGQTLGLVGRVDKEERMDRLRSDFTVDIETLLGGMVAERLFFGPESQSSGVSSDLQKVSSIARRMVRRWGMGSFPFDTTVAFGRGVSYEDGVASPDTERQLEIETHKIVSECLANTEKLLTSHRSQLEDLAKALIEKETLYYRDVVAILDPHRTDAEVERELQEIAERKLVGKANRLPMNGILGLGTPSGTNNRDIDLDTAAE